MNQQEYRKFGMIMALMVALFFGGLLPWIFTWEYSIIPWFISASLLGLALLAPKALIILYKPWMYLGNILAYINTRVILAIVFFGVFVPIALILKIMNKNPIRTKIYKQSSYWEEKQLQDRQHMEKIY